MIFQAKTQAEIFLLSGPPGSRESQERRGSNLDVDEGAKPPPTPQLPCGSLGAGQWEPVGDWGQAIGRLGARDQLYKIGLPGKSILRYYFKRI